MADLYSVAFVGNGETTKENVAALLTDFLSEDKDYNPPIFPSVRPRESVGLTRAYDWTAAEFGTANLDEVDLPLIVGKLLKQQGDENAPAIPFLVYAPPAELDTTDASYHQVLKARDAGIRVLDLTAGLDDLAFPAEPVEAEASPDPEPETRRERKMRGVPREDSEVDAATAAELAAELAASMQREDPPWDEDEDRETPKLDALVAPVATGVQVTLSQATVDLLMATFTSLAQDVASALIPKPKSDMVAVFVTEDGQYRRAERGRPRKGETRTEITAEQAKELGL